jgi:flavodoxin I
MKTLVIYDSVFGNTEKVAHAIAESLGTRVSVEIHKPDQVVPEQLTGVDLLVVGSPTRGFRPTEALAGLLKRIPSKALTGVKVAAFDTRFKVDQIESKGVRLIVKTGGYAAKRISDQLKKLGANLIVPPEGFFVKDTEGPLLDGEIERASAWALSLLDIH